MEREQKKGTISHELGAGAPCLKCREKCEGFELHFWRKICRNCKCGLEEHDIQMEEEAQRKVGRLFEDSRYAGVADRIRSDMETRLEQQQPRGVGGHNHRIVLDDRSPSAQLSFSSLSIGSSSSSSSNFDSGFDSASLASSGSGMPRSAGAGPGDGKVSGSAAGGEPGLPRAPGSAPGAATGRDSQTGGSVGVGGSPGGPGSVQLSGSSTAPPAGGVPSRVPGGGGGPGAAGATVAGGDVRTAVVLEWAPPGLERAVARRYIELLPRDKQPIEGSQGAMYRRRQLARQLPEHDQDPSRCHDLSAAEVKQMEDFVKKYKAEALGVGDVMLPHQVLLIQGGVGGGFTHGMGPGATGSASSAHGSGAGSGGHPSAPPVGGELAGGAADSPSRKRRCNRCKQPMQQGDPAVFAERAGSQHLWHPGCFCCSACDEILVDLVYFWKRGKLYCGRHYCDTERPRCGGCDELIFSKEYTQAEEQNWHLKHFCCFECDCVLAGEIYVMEQDKPVCKPCYMKKYARSCQSCQGSIEPEAQRVTLGEFSWHADPTCFLCSCCGIPLVGLRFLPHQAMIFCSADCRGKVVG
ncbi:unnamed protein product [Lampetra fluviatilis]